MVSLAGWQNFCVIVGSSAGALIGLQFIAMTLMAELPLFAQEAEQVGNAFATPTVVHFGAVLLVAAILSLPWNGISVPAVLWGLVGLGGAIYCLIVARRQTAQKTYQPVLEDWLYYFAAPLACYLLLLAASVGASAYPTESLFVVAGAILSLLFTGIHNAWDSTSYGVFLKQGRKHGHKKKRKR